jgi:hypothetical protein
MFLQGVIRKETKGVPHVIFTYIERETHLHIQKKTLEDSERQHPGGGAHLADP